MGVQLLFLLLLTLGISYAEDEYQIYIVLMNRNQFSDHKLTTKLHIQTLADVLGSEDMANDAMLYSYKHGFSGFAANINSAHADAVSRMPDVVSVFPSRTLKLHTTHSWDFMGLDVSSHHGLLSRAKSGVDVIVGVIDTGIWPEAESFNDNLMPPIPTRWKGICQAGEAFNSSHCNRKVIGARYFNKAFVSMYGNNSIKSDYKSPRDSSSHGTHVASTAAGKLIKNANYKGFGSGIARGGAPQARLAIYKVVWGDEVAADADVLQAFDSAIHDGVDIISLSLGQNAFVDYATDVLALGSFHAVENGILVVASAGNEGPSSSTVQNVAPWILTVAASTMDRGFYARLQLMDNETCYQARSIDNASGLHAVVGGKFCNDLEANKVRGNYVLCRDPRVLDQSAEVKDNLEILAAVKGAGGAGIIREVDLYGSDFASELDKHAIPLFEVSHSFAMQLASYIAHGKSPAIYVNPAKTVIGEDPAPALAVFSARGPSKISPEILKPDVTAPGVEIMAAVPSPGLRNSFDLKSGTSMSCPHVSALAALIKSVRPSWSPSAIKSAIITTASNLDNTGDVIRDIDTQDYANAFGFGAGHVDPTKAADPGLIYDASFQDYASFCCRLGYRCKLKGLNCYSVQQHLSATDLNYPSIAISKIVGAVTVNRVVTNVGAANSIYRVLVEEPHGVQVSVEPKQLVFCNSIKQRAFQVKFVASRTSSTSPRYVFGAITWLDGIHSVRSPIAVQI